MDYPTSDEYLRERNLQPSRLRSTSVIALGSAMPASAPTLALTGSFALCALVAILVVACVAVAAFLI
ncbi:MULTISPECIES: hypothetical protein [Rhodococcus]|uniref:hypothetical protein n=1 Tax=Rhodococcus TaxID=1827 RepID=UPI0009779B3F|nr:MULTISPECIES: hypothetical protein [Rhodococcus]OMQ24343.1 hypothetical protein BK799_31445 [Rhodococcus sp. D-1]